MKARIKFSKTGIVKYMGHLDVLRYFQKAFRRSGIDICYSMGYSPHPIISFAAPLGVGLESTGEYMDIELNSAESSQVMMEKLNHVMVEGFHIEKFVHLENATKKDNGMAITAAADYHVEFSTEGADWTLFFEQLMNQEQIVLTKRSKTRVKEVDIKPMIYQWKLLSGGVELKLATGSTQNLKPDLVMDGLEDILRMSIQYTVSRSEIYAVGKEALHFVPLWQMGEDF